MTKKDYELIARSIKTTLGAWDDEQKAVHVLGCLVSGMADDLGTENSRFDRAIFIKACGFEGLAK